MTLLDHETIDVSTLWLRTPGQEGDVSKILASLTNGEIVTSPAEVCIIAEAAIARNGDLGRSLLWAAASLGSRRAATLLAKEIEVIVSAYGDLDGAEQRRMVNLIAIWRKNASADRFHDLSKLVRDDSGNDCRLERAIDNVIDRKADPVPGVVVVCTAFGDDHGSIGTGRDGYDDLVGTTVPFAAAVPASGTVAARILARWPWAVELADRLEDRAALARSVGSERFAMDPLLLVGPAGVGKSRLAMAAASALRLPALLLDASAPTDGDPLAAVSRDWRSSRPCAPVVVMRNENCSNPVVIIDHLDRCSSHGRPGKMALTLAAMIDHPQRYHDAYFTSDVDLSAVTFIATAAAADLLQPSIRDKFDVVAVPHPQPQHLPAIIASLAEDEASRLGIMTAFLPSLPPGSNEVMETLIRDRSSLRTVARAYRRMLSAAARVECGRQPAFN